MSTTFSGKIISELKKDTKQNIYFKLLFIQFIGSIDNYECITLDVLVYEPTLEVMLEKDSIILIYGDYLYGNNIFFAKNIKLL